MTRAPSAILSLHACSMMAVALMAAAATRAPGQVLTVDPYEDLIDLHHLAEPLNGQTGQTGSWDRTGGNGDGAGLYDLERGFRG